MTKYEINRTLAEKVMGVNWDNYVKWCCENYESINTLHNYCENRDDLTEVLRKLTPDQRTAVMDRLARIHAELPSDSDGFVFWSMTCDPAIIAETIVKVIT